jgi:hypothetical protein
MTSHEGGITSNKQAERRRYYKYAYVYISVCLLGFTVSGTGKYFGRGYCAVSTQESNRIFYVQLHFEY